MNTTTIPWGFYFLEKEGYELIKQGNLWRITCFNDNGRVSFVYCDDLELNEWADLLVALAYPEDEWERI